MADVTLLLESMEDGNTAAAAELLPLVYEELRRLAASRMAHEPPGHTLQPTALVHEAWIRMTVPGTAPYRCRHHFFAAAAEAMRRILIERARRRRAAKRGGGEAPLDLEEVPIPAAEADDDRLLALNEALERFASVEPRKADLVKLRYFVGLTFDEAAAALEIAVPTAKQWWAYSRAWLQVEMQRSLR